MFDLLFLIPALPFAGFLALALAGKRLTRTTVAVIGCGSVGLSALLSLAVAARYLLEPPQGDRVVQTLWTWLAAGTLSIDLAFALDPLSLIMMLTITVVGFLIHLYSTEFMQEDEGYSRFFASLNLFVGAMLTLVLADNLLLLYLGWEGVGLCSYLLIGFWYRDPSNGRAAARPSSRHAWGYGPPHRPFPAVHEPGHPHDPGDRGDRAGAVPGRFVSRCCRRGPPPGRRRRQIGAAAAPDLVARRHGGTTPVSALIHAATMVTPAYI